jgi:hypothetical protein
LLAVESVSWVFVLPKIIDVAPVFAAIVPEIRDLAFIVARPLIPILLAICDCLISLRWAIAELTPVTTLESTSWIATTNVPETARKHASRNCSPSNRTQLAPLHPVGNLSAPGALAALGALKLAIAGTLASSRELTGASLSTNIRKPFVAARAGPALSALSDRRKSWSGSFRTRLNLGGGLRPVNVSSGDIFVRS